MLLEKQIQQGDIVALRLVSGEEIVGKIGEVEGHSIQLFKPLVLGMQQQQNSQTGQVEIGMAFAPFMLALADDDSVIISAENIITRIKAREEVRNSYIKSTSDIEVPTKSTILQ